MKFLTKIELLLIAVWIGAATFFSLGVAPSSFSVLPTSELAAGVVNRTLTIINFSGLVIGLLLLLATFISVGKGSSIWIWSQRILLLVVAAACGAGQLIIGVYLDYLRRMMDGPLDSLAAESPLRLQFNTWHQYSIWALITAIVAALVAFFVISRTSSGSPKSAGSDDIPEFEFPDNLKM